VRPTVVAAAIRMRVSGGRPVDSVHVSYTHILSFDMRTRPGRLAYFARLPCEAEERERV
jgi:hypothetical protein